MREVVENSHRAVGYSCSEGIKCEIQNDNFKRELFDVAYPHGKLHLGRRTHVMGILNVTPDSFYDCKRYNTAEDAVNHASKMLEEGADIIDVGGESTRPGAYPISEAEELKRVIPLIKLLSKEVRKPISIDTYMAKVAEKAKVPVIIMHKKGNPRIMQKYPLRKNVMSEILSYLQKSVSRAVNAGIDEDKIILDPGIVFCKTLRQNLKILKRLKEFKSMGFPILIGTSRKQFIGAILKLSTRERLYGTLATLSIAVMNGAHIVRVHDVREAVQVVRICDAIGNN